MSKLKEEMAASKARAKMQHGVQKESMMRDIKDVSEREVAAAEFRVMTGEVDFSLHNWIMTTTDFKKCTELLEVVMEYYRRIYSYLLISQRNNEEMKSILKQISARSDDYKLNRAMRKRIDNALAVESPFLIATRGLKEVSKRAKARSKLGIKSYDEAAAKAMGIEVPRND